MADSKKPSRKRRRDYGSVQRTTRDDTLLTWIGEQFAIRQDHLQILAACHTDRTKLKDPYRLTVSGVRQRLYQRWEKAGWIEREKVYHHQDMWLWLSRAGVRAMSLKYPYRRPSSKRFDHIYHVNVVRLYLEMRGGQNVQWICERAVSRRRRQADGKHVVDGELIYQDQHTFAIEVELTAKTERRLDAILAELLQEYDGIYYFANDDCYKTVAAAVKRCRPADRKKFQLYHLEKIVRQVTTGEGLLRR